jgi:amino acid transporter
MEALGELTTLFPLPVFQLSRLIFFIGWQLGNLAFKTVLLLLLTLLGVPLYQYFEVFQQYRPDLPTVLSLRFVGIVGLSGFCLVHYFSGRARRALNQFLVLCKVSLLIIVILVGIAKSKKHYKDDWRQSRNLESRSIAAVIVTVMFSFLGARVLGLVSYNLIEPLSLPC